MKKTISYLLAFFVLIISSELSASADTKKTNDGWKAGVAKVSITPEKLIWMGGYAFRDHPAEGKLTDLWAKALTLEGADGQKAVIITTDLVGISKELSDNIRKQISVKLHLTYSQIILNTSHTHTGPVVGNLSADIYNLNAVERKSVNEYAELLQRKIINLVVEAFGKMKPAKLYSGNGITRFQVNRHTNKESDLTATTHLNGPNDYSVPVLSVTDHNNNNIAILFGYACHNTTLSIYKWSGDYAGFAQLELEKKYPEAIALFFQGAGGDQNPLPRRTVSLAKQYGKELAAGVEAVLEGVMKPLQNQLLTTYSEIDLPFAKRPPTKEELIRIINDSSASAYPSYLKRKAKRFLNTLESGGSIMSSYPWYPVQVWNLGGQAIFTFGGELTVGYSVDLKQIFDQDIFVMGYSNNVMSYIPTAKMLTEGGYEVTMSPVFTTPYASSVEKLIVTHAVEAAAKVGFRPKSSLLPEHIR